MAAKENPPVNLNTIDWLVSSFHVKAEPPFAKYKLPFTLLVDTDHAISDAYGVYGEKKFMGRTYLGIKRMTFLIDEKGKIKKIFEKVKPEEHAREVLEAF